MSLIDDLKQMEANIAAEVQSGSASTKDYIAQQYQANLDRIAALQSVAATALQHVDILKGDNDKLMPFV